MARRKPNKKGLAEGRRMSATLTWKVWQRDREGQKDEQERSDKRTERSPVRSAVCHSTTVLPLWRKTSSVIVVFQSRFHNNNESRCSDFLKSRTSAVISTVAGRLQQFQQWAATTVSLLLLLLTCCFSCCYHPCPCMLLLLLLLLRHGSVIWLWHGLLWLCDGCIRVSSTSAEDERHSDVARHQRRVICTTAAAATIHTHHLQHGRTILPCHPVRRLSCRCIRGH